MNKNIDNPSPYMALYRVFRPKRFKDVRGQEHITDILKKQIEIGKNAHAYLFCGTRGTGKTSTARILANALNCRNPIEGEPCGKCDICAAAANESMIDVIEIDAASNNGVDHVRELRESVMLSPLMGRFRVYIIDEVHMLSPQAFNALLKTLEEPPPHAVFILATTELKKVPITIKSRCQFFSFKRIDKPVIVQTLKDIAAERGIEYEDRAIDNLASHADGALRDALSLMDQCLLTGSLTEANVHTALGLADSIMISALADAVAKQDVQSALGRLNAMLNNGAAAEPLFRELILELSRILVKNARDEIKRGMLLRQLNILQEAQGMLKYAESVNQFCVVTLLRATSPAAAYDDKDIALRVKRLEQLVQELRQEIDSINKRALPAIEKVWHKLSGDNNEQNGDAARQSPVAAKAGAVRVPKAEVNLPQAEPAKAYTRPVNEYAAFAKEPNALIKEEGADARVLLPDEAPQPLNPAEQGIIASETTVTHIVLDEPQLTTVADNADAIDGAPADTLHAEEAPKPSRGRGRPRKSAIETANNADITQKTADDKPAEPLIKTDDTTLMSAGPQTPAEVSDEKLLGILMREVPKIDASMAVSILSVRKIKRTGAALTLYAKADDMINMEILARTPFAIDKVLKGTIGGTLPIKIEEFVQTDAEKAAEEDFDRQAEEVFKEYFGEENFIVEDED